MVVVVVVTLVVPAHLPRLEPPLEQLLEPMRAQLLTHVSASAGPRPRLDPARFAELLAGGATPTRARATASVLTGAGVSTESGLPDYRGEHGLYRDGTRRVQSHDEYVRDEHARKRYWARAVSAFGRFTRARPNETHWSLAALERAGFVSGLVTQNVDRLHSAAGSRRVVELHGRGDRVHCVECEHEATRAEYVDRLHAANPSFVDALRAVDAEARPDFDAAVPEDQLTRDALSGFRLPPCAACGFPLVKPSFVFFGGSVPRPVADEAARVLASAPLMLVVGTTATTYSAFRPVSLARAAHGVRVGVVNRGATRVDPLADLGFFDHASCADFFRALCAELGVRARGAHDGEGDPEGDSA